MTEDVLLAVGREALLLMIVASLPPIAAALVVGFLTGVFQAATQIQEATLSFAPRLLAAVGALVVAAPWISARLGRFTSEVLRMIVEVGS